MGRVDRKSRYLGPVGARAAAALVTLSCCATAQATPFDECGTFVQGAFQTCILFQPDNGSQRVWATPLPASFHVGDHARVQGDFILCPSPCMAPCVTGAVVTPCQAACNADFDRDGTLTVADIFAFLGAWFAGSLLADFDGNGTLSTADIFVFLNEWFAGCP